MRYEGTVMGMPVAMEIVDGAGRPADFEAVMAYFTHVDRVFSTYKPDSEISRLNRGEMARAQCCGEVRNALELCEKTTLETKGYFDMRQGDKLDPSGLVKGLAISEAARLLRRRGMRNFYVEIGGDIEVSGHDAGGEKWRVGIRNPFDTACVAKIVALEDRGIATSGTYARGGHIYDPVNQRPAAEIASIRVIGPDVYEADRFATAACAMGRKGIYFIELLPGFDAFMVTNRRVTYATSGFEQYVSE
ncbi:MAG: FAD:protein FMN transferase [SAR202 cluster bacterium]|nr:FAD:protein FMN transferase [SAR202 cluster bacterium]